MLDVLFLILRSVFVEISLHETFKVISGSSLLREHRACRSGYAGPLHAFRVRELWHFSLQIKLALAWDLF